jgi:hypothetical protein
VAFALLGKLELTIFDILQKEKVFIEGVETECQEQWF